jgi:hypothetical protein
MVIVFAIGPRFTSSNPAESDEFLRAIKIHSTASFEEEVKPSAPCHKILLHVKDPMGYDRYLWAKFSCHFSPVCY